MKRQVPRVLGYGEDPLTYHVLTMKLHEFLSNLGDDTNPNDALILYRPSFGRGTGSNTAKRHSTFGEFDAIVAAKEAVYLIESKWHRSSEITKKEIKLSETQKRRHKIFQWYRENWRPSYEKHWTTFVKDMGKDFEKKFEPASLPSEDTMLSKNIEFVLRQLEPYPKRTENVLLYIYPANQPGKKRTEIRGRKEGFRVVPLDYSPVEEATAYFAMS